MFSYVLSLIIIIIIIIVYMGGAWWPKPVCDKCASCPPPGPVEQYTTNSCIGTFDCMNEDFTAAGDIAAHTMWQGYQYRTTLPGL